MKKPLIPDNEKERIAKLQEYEILDTIPEKSFDDIVSLASHICGTPIALVSLVDSDRQWFKAKVGLDADQTPRDVSFCGHAINDDEVFYVPNAENDERFHDNPLVTGGPRVIFYAGAPIKAPSGEKLGTLCVIDNKAGELNQGQKEALEMLSRQVSDQLELRLNLNKLNEEKCQFEQLSRMLAEINKLNNTDFKNLDQLFKAYIEVGKKTLGLDIGILSEINGPDYIVRCVEDSSNNISIGDVFELKNTYCQKVFEQERTIFYDEVGRIEEMVSHPVYQAMKLESYISTPVFVNGKIFGTLNFSSIKIRKNQFDKNELHFIEILGQAISRRYEVLDKVKVIKGQRNFYESILNNMAEGFVIQNFQGEVTNCNRSALDVLGLRRDQLFGNEPLDDAWQAINEDGSPFELKKHPAFKTLKTGSSFSDIKVGISLPDGETRWLSINTTPLYLEDQSRSVISSFRDVTREVQLNTDLMDAKNRAEEATVAKSQFMANMSHELRTPLNAIIGYSEFIQEDHPNLEPDILEDLNKIKVSGEHLLNLINQVLDISKIEAGKMETYNEVIEVSSFFNNLEDLVKPLVSKNNNVLSISNLDIIESFKGDREKVKQILLNLISNAAKFTLDGKIEIELSRCKNEPTESLIFSVRDNGKGISKSKQKAIFEDFTQEDASTTRDYGGTGLGLSICKKFAQIMDGDISIESEEGKGSCFKLKIPLLTDTLHDSLDSNYSQHELDKLVDVRTILIIDDDPLARELTNRSLAGSGWNVQEASHPQLGVQKAISEKPDLIILDVVMPDRDGFSVLAELKLKDETKDIPVIMMTMVGDDHRGYLLGASDYLLKPVQKERLLEVVKKHFNNELVSVLVVEDDKATRELTQKVLSKSGIKVQTATNGQEALDLIERNIGQPYLVLLDLMMPTMDGFEFLEKIENKGYDKFIDVVVLSAKELDEGEFKWLKERVLGISQKGQVSSKQLVDVIKDKIGIKTVSHKKKVA